MILGADAGGPERRRERRNSVGGAETSAAGPGIWEIDPNGGVCRTSERMRVLHGWSDDCRIGWKRLLSAIHPEDRKRVLAVFRRAIRERSPFSIEYRTRHRLRWIVATGGFRQNPVSVLCGACRDISERKEREARLVAAARELRAKSVAGGTAIADANRELASRETEIRFALSAAGAGVWNLDLRSRELEFDDICLGFFGFPEGTAPGLDEVLGKIHPDSRSEVVRSLEAVSHSSGGDDWNVQFRVACPSHEIRWLAGKGRVFRDRNGCATRMSGINIDISRRKEAELTRRRWTEQLEKLVEERSRELWESEARFRCLAGATYDGVVVLDGGVIVDINPQAGAMFGYERNEVIGRSGLQFVAPESVEFIAWTLSVLATERYEWFGMRKDGARFPVESRARRVAREGRTLLVATLSDLTEQKRLEAAIAAQRKELERTRELALISEIAAGIVHQISQPLSAIGGTLAAVKAWLHACPAESCPVAEWIGEAVSHVSAMREGVRRLRALSVSRRLELVPMSIGKVVTDVLPLLKLEADARRIALRADLAPGLPEVDADGVHLGQVVISLVRNAIEACQGVAGGGEGSVTIRTGRADDGNVEISVMDTGGGLSDEIHGRLFAPFVTTKPGGAGIGLRLCQMIIHNHGGIVTGGNTDDGSGACFRIVLPAGDRRNHTKV